METDLNKLQEKLDKLNRQRINLINRIDAIKTKNLLPSLKEKYEGKYFKYTNSYSLSEKWFMYSKCVKVIDHNFSLSNNFQTTTSGDRNFNKMDKNGFHLFETEITKEEYQAEFLKFKNTLNKLKD